MLDIAGYTPEMMATFARLMRDLPTCDEMKKQRDGVNEIIRIEARLVEQDAEIAELNERLKKYGN